MRKNYKNRRVCDYVPYFSIIKSYIYLNIYKLEPTLQIQACMSVCASRAPARQLCNRFGFDSRPRLYDCFDLLTFFSFYNVSGGDWPRRVRMGFSCFEVR